MWKCLLVIAGLILALAMMAMIGGCNVIHTLL